MQVWHRAGWKLRGQVTPAPGNEYHQGDLNHCDCQEHIHTHTFSHGQSHSYRTVLHRTWVLGRNGVPHAITNTQQVLSEINNSLRRVHSTNQSTEATLALKPDDNNIDERALLMQKLCNQMTEFTEVMNQWSAKKTPKQQRSDQRS